MKASLYLTIDPILGDLEGFNELLKLNGFSPIAKEEDIDPDVVHDLLRTMWDQDPGGFVDEWTPEIGDITVDR